MGDIASDKHKKMKRKKERKVAIELSLWINGCKYEFGLLCTFCTKQKAVCHCPECTDFYCQSCDTIAHNTKKRKHHVRSRLSHLDMNKAARLITRAVRCYGHLHSLQNRCRQVIKRFFDKKTLNYYYFNPIYGTVSWRKPYCLRNQELMQYMPREYAASKCQNLYHLWKARQNTRNLLLNSYSKIFNRSIGRFYYAFHGKSRLLPRASWQKSRLLGRRSFPRDLVPLYTDDVAALIIQRKWRSILMRQFFRALVRASYDELWDPIKGRYNYYHRETAKLLQEKPPLLGNEPWDPHRVPEWSMDKVSLFLRRIGLKKYVDTMRGYHVDGNALVLLDDEDYENLEIKNKLHIRKIRVEIDKIFDAKKQKKVLMSADHELRREKIRRQKMFHAAATKIQAQFRRFVAQKELSMFKEMHRIRIVEEFRKQKVLAGSIWWTENKALPSKNLSVLPSIGSNGVKLPPIKAFGRNRDHKSFRGWARKAESFLEYQSLSSASNSSSDFKRYIYENRSTNSDYLANAELNRLANLGPGKWIATAAAVLDPQFQGEDSPTLIFSEKLHKSGYDDQRLQRFLFTSI